MGQRESPSILEFITMGNRKNTVNKCMELIIQIPCYNEAETLSIALDALPRAPGGIDCVECLIMSDDSGGDTPQAAR